MLSIILFILVLTFLILIHELGHFFVARKCKVKIEEFGLGIPPRAGILFHWKGIPITLNWLFLGGFVRMEGEDQVTSRSVDKSTSKSEFFPFYSRKLWQKILIVLAGPTVNILFGVIVFSTLFSLYGIPVTTKITPKVTAVSQNSPAQKAGILKEDQLLRIQTGDGKTKQEITDAKAMITFVNAHRGETLTMIIKREGNEITIPVYARKESEIPSGEGTIGIALTDTDYSTKFYPGIEQPVRGMMYGIQQSIAFGGSILNALAGIGKSLGSGRVPSDISGPVGIAHEVQKEDLFSSGWATGFNFAALLSINLGVMNLLPIPALDGGRIFLLILEKLIKGKRFESISQNLNQFGFLFLMGLLLLITIKDLFAIFVSK